MGKRLEGRRADILRFGLGARNWLVTQIPEDLDLSSLPKPDRGRTAAEIVDHIVWVINTVFKTIAQEVGIELEKTSSTEDSGKKERIYAAFELFGELCEKLTDEMLDIEVSLPPPSRLRRGTIDRVLRIIAGYHVVHHAGQVATLIGHSKTES